MMSTSHNAPGDKHLTPASCGRWEETGAVLSGNYRTKKLFCEAALHYRNLGRHKLHVPLKAFSSNPDWSTGLHREN